MFFETLGPLLTKAGQVLDTNVRDRIDDEFTLRELDAISMLVCEVGAAWNSLFAALVEENRILEIGLDEANALIGREPVPRDQSEDPLATNADLLRRIAITLAAFHSDRQEAAVASLRETLHKAAELQNRLVSEARINSPIGEVRRV